MTHPLVMRYFLGVPKSSDRNHPLRSTGLAVGLYNSMASTNGGSVWVSTSLTMILAKEGVGGSDCPGAPLITPLGRQPSLWSQAPVSAASSATTSEKPGPSVMGYQLLL